MAGIFQKVSKCITVMIFSIIFDLKIVKIVILKNCLKLKKISNMGIDFSDIGMSNLKMMFKSKFGISVPI